MTDFAEALERLKKSREKKKEMSSPEDIVLTDDQEKVIQVFKKFILKPKEKYMIIQGAAGTGKTTLIKYLYRAMVKQLRVVSTLMCKDPNQILDIQLAATTNKAAAVLEELTGIEARTIHSLLGLRVRPDFASGELRLQKNKNHEVLRDKFIVVDEVSMMNDELWTILDESIIDCKVVLMGDMYQLAPVKQKKSIMEKLDCTKVAMNKVMRHAGPILHTSAQFRSTVETGEFQPIPSHPEVEHVDGPTFQKMINEAFTHPDYNANSAKVLAWSNSRVNAYNEYIRKAKGLPEVFEEGESAITNNAIITTKGKWHVDSTVRITQIGRTQTQRDIEGCMVEIDNAYTAFMPYRQYEVKALLKGLAKAKKWRSFYDIKENWLDLRPVFSSTVHKSQGSTYGTVFIDLVNIGKCNIPTDVARLLYVSISRAKNKVVLYGALPPKYQGAMAA